jgi:hypothetical protein
MAEEMRKFTAKFPKELYWAMIAWVKKYNEHNCHKAGFQKLLPSDIVRLSVESFVSSVSYNKFFI